MGKKNKSAELLELFMQQRGIKMKKKAIQFECPHKDHKGHIRLRSTGKEYVFKCKLCRDKKVDLSIVDRSKGEIGEQINAAYRTFKSAIDLAKIQSSSKDTKTLEMLASTLKKVWSTKRVLKKILAPAKGKKKFSKRGVNVAQGGRSLFGGR